MIRSTFSTTTIASSTTMPIASTRPNSVRRLIEKPSASMPAKVVTSATTIATAQMKVVRRLCRKRYTTSTTSIIAMISVWMTSSIEIRTKSLVSSAIAVLDAVGEAALHLLERLADRRRHDEAVRARLLVDGDERRRLIVEPAVDDVLLQADARARDVADAHDRAAVLARAQDDLLVLLRVGERALRHHREAQLDRRGGRLLADLPGAEERVLGGDRVLDVAGRDLERGHAVRVHPDPHRLVRDAHDLRLAGALHALQRVEHVDVRVVRDVLGAVAGVLREDGDQHHDRRRLLLDVHAQLHHRRRQLRHREVDPVLHLHLRDVRVGVEREVDGQRHLPVRRARRRHVEHVVDAVDLRLDRRGHRFGDGPRVGAGVGRLHRHLHRRDVRDTAGPAGRSATPRRRA